LARYYTGTGISCREQKYRLVSKQQRNLAVPSKKFRDLLCMPWVSLPSVGHVARATFAAVSTVANH
ncbi:MAG TPA: hypothetical protein VHV10_05940, partial [Ktedonobacteraceae bacterium]|nr:hypothetical protein [Ktedonobacteraceae bacterium]